MSEYATGNDRLLLLEIRHALAQLLQTGADHLINLQNIPLSPQERQSLLQFLGEGEIYAELAALGKSVIRETKIAGVWLTTHYNTEGEVLAELLEITRIPAILQSDPEDMAIGLDQLDQQLAIPVT